MKCAVIWRMGCLYNLNLIVHPEKQTATDFLRSRLFTYDIMKNFNWNIFLWSFRSKFRSYIGKHLKRNNGLCAYKALLRL